MFKQLPDVIGYSTIADVGYPSEICSTIFVGGCNFRCPYCINRCLLDNDTVPLDTDDILNAFWLRREKKIVVSGGEPFIHRNIFNLFEKIKSKGFSVAVATNGSFYSELVQAVSEKLVDHVILDIKAPLNKKKYSAVAGRELTDDEFNNILMSVEYIRKIPRWSLNTEFRSTICSKFITKEDVFEIAKYIGEGNVYFLQPFTTHQTLDKEMADNKYVVPYEEIVSWAKELDNSVVSVCFVREV